MTVAVKVVSPDFVKVSRALADAGRGDLRKELVKSIRKVANPVRDDMRSAVRGLSSKADGSGGGSRARAGVAGQRLAESRAKRGKALTEKDLSRIVRGSGLREATAKAITLVVRDNGNTPGVYITVRSAGMPSDQRALPRYMNNPKGWRHPVFGNRNAWVTQTTSPTEWFGDTARRHHPKVRAAVEDAVRDFTRHLLP